ARLLRRPVGVEVQRLGVHGQRGEQDVVGLGDSAAGAVQVAGALAVLLEPESALDDAVPGVPGLAGGGGVVVGHGGSPSGVAAAPVPGPRPWRFWLLVRPLEAQAAG